MNDLFSLVLRVHILAAVLCTITFWIPVSTPKGGRIHVRSGKVYLALLVATVGTALLLTTLAFLFGDRARPEGTGMPLDVFEQDQAAYRLLLALLSALGVVTLTAAISGMRALHLHRRTRPLERLWHLLLGAAGLALATAGALKAHLPVVVVGLAFSAASAFAIAATRRTSPATRLADHAVLMLVSGIGLHSTVAVVLANRLVPTFFHGPFGTLIWALPTLIGLPLLIRVWRRTRTTP